MDCKSIKSNPSTQRIWYEVFLSFRGEDIRNNFVDHLFAALQKSGIFTFKDDERLSKGEVISTKLPEAIEESRISIVVFSKTYADSTWCLRELAKIVDCNMVLGQTVLPIFYDVDPSEVRKQSGNYGKSFAEYEKKFKDNLDLVNTWRIAMSKVADLSGWDVRNKRESRVIDEIVQKALSMLGHKFSSLTDDLVGIESRVEALEKILDLDSNDDDVRVLGIIGMGGIGKTTLAAIVYDRISHKFDASSFLMNISKGSKGDGVLRLQEQLLSETLMIENLKIWHVYNGTTLIKTRLKNLRTLLVLDNVNHLDELENLAKKPNWFGAGSRIIITTRDKHILNNYGAHEIYRVKHLNYFEAHELFCRKAFKHCNPMSDYEWLTYRVLQHVKGLPLAAKVLGSSLFNKDVSIWECTLARLQENPEKEIMDILRTTFDGLQVLEREIFLDIACFFHGMYKDDVKRILNCCGLHPESGISTLIDKSLLTIINCKIQMHDLLQELGRSIVRENFPTRPEKWSRLWLYKNFHHVMMETRGTKNVEAIALDYSYGIALQADTLSNLSHLRLLIFRNVNFSGSLRSLSNKLKYLEWHEYPFTYLPSSFQLDTLVELIMPYSCIKQLWEGLKLLPNLRSINLRQSKNLIKMPDFRGIPNLERLDLEGCTRLLRLDESIGVLAKLTYLNLNLCKNLVNIPLCIFGLSSLETLCLLGCSILGKRLKKLRHAEEVDRTGQLLLSIVCKKIKMPIRFFSREHKGSIGFPLVDYLNRLSFLKFLNLGFCHLSEIPDSIGWLHCLELLYLSGNDFSTLPSTINKLSKLSCINLMHCKNLQYLPELPSNIFSSKPCEPICMCGLNIFNCSKFYEIERCSSMVLSRVVTFFEELHDRNSHRLIDNVIPGSGIGGTDIFSCSKFCEFERCSSMALSKSIPFLEELHGSEPFTMLHNVIPGSEIPRWFSCQRLGASIRIRVPSSVRDSNWLGLAFCASFVALDPHPPLDADGHLKTSPQCALDNGVIASFSVFFKGEEPVAVELDHIGIICVARQDYFKSEIKEREHIDVAIKIGPEWEIKKCGVRLVFKESLERLKYRLMHAGNNMQIPDLDDFGIAHLFESYSSDAGKWSE